MTPRLNIPKKYRLAAAIVAVAVAALVGLYEPSAEVGQKPANPPGAGYVYATVVEVYDGDTILVRVGGLEERVRLIGIDCPEARENEKHFRDARRDKRHRPAELIRLGRKAKKFTAKMAPPGSTVRLEFDAQERDKYGRLLAYVWLRQGPGAGGQGPGKEVMLNALLVKEGMAGLMTIPPNVRHVELFKRLQAEARAAGRGLWAKDK
jgi:micrococcal nuclease